MSIAAPEQPMMQIASLTSTAPRPTRPSVLSSSLTFAWRSVLKVKHVPEQALDVLAIPIVFTLMFTYLFGGAVAGSTQKYLHFLLPGTLVMTVLLLTTYTGVALSTDVTSGSFDRFRSMPIWRPAPVVGALIGDVGGLSHRRCVGARPGRGDGLSSRRRSARCSSRRSALILLVRVRSPGSGRRSACSCAPPTPSSTSAWSCSSPSRSRATLSWNPRRRPAGSRPSSTQIPSRTSSLRRAWPHARRLRDRGDRLGSRRHRRPRRSLRAVDAAPAPDARVARHWHPTASALGLGVDTPEDRAEDVWLIEIELTGWRGGGSLSSCLRSTRPIRLDSGRTRWRLRGSVTGIVCSRLSARCRNG